MELAVILKSLRRNKIGAVVIAVQIAVTLAILCNALFIIQQRLANPLATALSPNHPSRPPPR